MVEKNRCPYCNKLFEVSKKHKVYCSKECSKEWFKQSARQVNKEDAIARARKVRVKTWYDVYQNADALTKAAMIAKANFISYGRMQTMSEEVRKKMIARTIEKKGKEIW